ncbi:MAG: OsmC family protein [Bacteroidales bacterium]|jgi:putative redox protein|nr:OsmC family protein [Bacteroidales bacterium]
MSKEIVTTTWSGGMSFEGNVSGHKITIDAGNDFGGNDLGPRPKPLMMLALAGCTGMDVVSILRKMKVNFNKFNVIVEGQLTEEHPKQFSRMHIIYEFGGTDLPMEKLRKAVDLSQEKYCGVSAMYRKVMELTSEIRIVS